MLGHHSVVFGVASAWLSTVAGLPAEVLSIGHRGNSMFAPENTVAAIVAAHGKADMIETDVRATSDGHLILMHDSTVNRTTDGTGSVSAMTLAQLRALDAGSWFATQFAGERVPTFAEMITNILPHATPLIEQKTGSAAAYVNALQQLGATTNVVLQSFDWNFLAAVHALDPTIPLCALGSGTFTLTSLTSITNTGARTVAWEKSSVTPAVLNMVRGSGLKLFVWTVNGLDIQNYINMGVDGIISDDPAKVRELQQPPTNYPINLAAGLIAYWNMDDGLTDAFTTTVSDQHGTNNATLVRNDGASHWFDGSLAKLGGSLKVEGASAYVTFPQNEIMDIQTNALSISLWVRLSILPSQLSTSFGAIFDSNTDCYVVYLDKGNQELRFKVTDVNNHAARPGIPETWLQTNEWLHVVGTYSGQAGPSYGEANIYLNGQIRDAHTGNDGSPSGLTGNIKTGQLAAMGREGPEGGNYFTGFVDDMALWNRALNPTEVRVLFEGGQQGLSLGALLPQATPLIEFISVRPVSAPADSLEIDFQNHGPWQTFRLLHATGTAGPFHVVAGLAPQSLGNNRFRFVYQLNGQTAEFFRVETE